MPDISSTNNAVYNQNFVSSILQRLPYVSDKLRTTSDNHNYELFDRLSKRTEQRLLKHSVITGNAYREDRSNPSNFSSESQYHKYIYAKLDTDKIRRIAEYRRMAAFAEVSDCLDEICNDFIVKDENNVILNIKYSSFSNLTNEEKKELSNEFHKFIDIYDLEHKGSGYCRKLLTEGEIFFENIIYKPKPEYGIIGVMSIPGELINPVYDSIQNSVIENFIFQKPISLNHNAAGPLSQSQSNISPVNPLQQQLLPMHANQITYIHSGMWNDDSTIRIPFIENCRRAYKQLSLLEDSIIIYRMTRAPERLKFTIDVGNMPPAKAEGYIKQLMQQYWNRQTYGGSSSGSSSEVINTYNPQSMLDSFWFARRPGEIGSDVTSLPGGQNLGQLDDLMYFVNKLYKSLKVPLTRLNPNEPFKDGAEILKAELRFANFIISVQQQFAAGLKQAFVAHLKIKNWWKEYDLHESYFNLTFNPPSNFFAIRQQQLLELKLKNFSDLSNNDSISNTFAQRHYLAYTDQKISENMEWKRKDAAFKWELAQIEANGPNWRELIEASQLAAAGGGVAGAPSETGGGVGGGTSPSSIPDFGTPGVETSGSETPAGAEATETPPGTPPGTPSATPPSSPPAPETPA